MTTALSCEVEYTTYVLRPFNLAPSGANLGVVQCTMQRTRETQFGRNHCVKQV